MAWPLRLEATQVIVPTVQGDMHKNKKSSPRAKPIRKNDKVSIIAPIVPKIQAIKATKKQIWADFSVRILSYFVLVIFFNKKSDS